MSARAGSCARCATRCSSSTSTNLPRSTSIVPKISGPSDAITSRSMSHPLRRIACLTLAAALAFSSADAQRGQRTITRPIPTMAGRSPVYAPNGVAATSQPLATSAAVNVLQSGGNAIDAAVTAAAVLAVVEPMMTGIGGDMFAIVWSAKDKKLYGLNASGRAGSLETREELIKRGRTRAPQRGPEAVTVPGALAGWQTLIQKFGTRTLAQDLQPAIQYAENGYPITPVIASDWRIGNILGRDGGAAKTFLLDGTRSPSP